MSALLGYHAFTGCDTTSAFSGRGKVKPLQIMGSSSEYIQAFASLGMSMDIIIDLLSVLDSLVCHMYGDKEAERQGISINDVRFMLCSSTMLEFLETTHHKDKLSDTYLEIYFGTSDGCC